MGGPHYSIASHDASDAVVESVVLVDNAELDREDDNRNGGVIERMRFECVDAVRR